MDNQQTASNETTVHAFNNAPGFSLNKNVYIVLVVALILGLLGGFLFSKGKISGITSTGTQKVANSGSVQKGAVFGSDDTSTFKDTAEGIMKKGGVDGEGQYHLVRPGGDSQNVYITSSTVDLSLFLDRKVKVWGQTQKAQVAGWLMDVGRVEVLE